MNVILILGPPAVGKMTVGKAIAERTGYTLFHNHMSIELVRKFFDFGTPEFSRLDKLIRFGIFKEVAQSDVDGFIFTLVVAFDVEEDIDYMQQIADVFSKELSELFVVELKADLEQRLIRNRGEDRLLEKVSKRDVERSEEVLLNHEKEYRMNTLSNEFPNWNLLKIDSTNLSAHEVAKQTISYFKIDKTN